MKLVYTELEQQLVFQENKVNVLVIEQKELFRRMIQELVPILAASVISTILVLAVTGWMHQFYGKAKDKSHDIFKHK